MLPPPPAIYNSADELYHNAQTFANSQGYALVKKRTCKDRHGELKNITLRCDQGGIYNYSLGLTEETCKRHKGTRLIDCPFELYAARDSNSKWRLEVCNENHNHDHSEDMSGHPIARRLTESQQETVAAITVAAGHTPIQALMDELKEGDFIYEYECDNAGCVTHLFFAHNDSIALTRQYSSVLIMDTYKTNKFKMPLLNIVGITSFNTTFYSCFIFIKGEEITDYQWALTCFSPI
ncbi:unnamed protein product [Rhizophagus irregularis]|nr:unnamed protein product [Rhizophagus irregularis]CAB4430780.1 unnamed protein product [Rhizophagus irregularis]